MAANLERIILTHCQASDAVRVVRPGQAKPDYLACNLVASGLAVFTNGTTQPVVVQLTESEAAVVIAGLRTAGLRIEAAIREQLQ